MDIGLGQWTTIIIPNIESIVFASSLDTLCGTIILIFRLAVEPEQREKANIIAARRTAEN